MEAVATREEQILSLRTDVMYFARTATGGRFTSLYDDYRSEGWIGACEAVDRHTESGGAPLRAFSRFYIRGRVVDFQRRSDPLTRGQRKKVKGGEDKDVEYVPLTDKVRDLNGEFKQAFARMEVEALLAHSGLSEREEQFVRFRYLDGLNLEEISLIAQCHYTRVSQVIGRALGKMRRMAEGNTCRT